MSSPTFSRIVLTGAAGRLGRLLWPTLRELCEELVLSDLYLPAVPLQTKERFVRCELADHAAVARLLEGADLVVHLGGVPGECGFDKLLPANFVGQFNIYDAAICAGVRRVVLASSNHVTGFYPTDVQVSPAMPMRPDSLYGVSKAYGELLAHFYFERHGLESVCLRIGNCQPRPRNARSLRAWLSEGDLCELVRCAVQAEVPGFAVVYGVSDNPGRWWCNDDAQRIRYQPQDSSAAFAAEFVEELAALAAAGTPGLQGGNTAMTQDYRDPSTLKPDARRRPPGEC